MSGHCQFHDNGWNPRSREIVRREFRDANGDDKALPRITSHVWQNRSDDARAGIADQLAHADQHGHAHPLRTGHQRGSDVRSTVAQRSRSKPRKSGHDGT